MQVPNVYRAATNLLDAATSSSPTSQNTSPSTSSSASNSVSIQEFMQLLSTEMANQDPLQPMDPTQTMTQLAQFTTLQQTAQMSQNQSLSAGASFVGQQVTISPGNDQPPVTGTVTGIDDSAVASGGEPELIVSGTTQEYPLTSVTQLGSASTASTPAASN